MFSLTCISFYLSLSNTKVEILFGINVNISYICSEYLVKLISEKEEENVIL